MLFLSLVIGPSIKAQDWRPKVYKDLDEALSEPDSVIILDLSGKRLRDFPMEIFTLPKLEVLRLRKCRLDSLPEIWPLPRLRVLYLEKNRLTDLPEAVYKSVRLEELRLGENELTEISPSIIRLKKLERLELWGNFIGRLPDNIDHLNGRLRVLDMRLMEVSSEEQIRIDASLPSTRTLFSTPCNCMDEELLESEPTEDR